MTDMILTNANLILDDEVGGVSTDSILGRG